MWKSIAAVVAGVLFVIIVTTIVDVVLHIVGVFPPPDKPLTDGLALLATSYRIAIGVAGAWLTAWLAPRTPMQHALVLGLVGIALGSVGIVVNWKLGLGPMWYPIALTVLSIPQCWAGGWIYERQLMRRP